jgi:tetratricopeptide (TPR) repeat protein
MKAREAAIVCRKCGALSRPTWEFCARCGESLQGAERVEVAAPPGAGEEEEPRPSPLPHWLAAAFLLVFGVGAVLAWQWVSNAPAPNRPDPGMFTIGTTPTDLSTPAPTPDPAPGAADYAEGRRLAAKGDLPGALAKLAAAVSADPSRAEYHNSYAHVLWRDGDRERALSELGEAARLDPRLQMEYARTLEIAGRSDEAVGVYETLIARNPDASVAQEDLGRLYFRAGDYAKAATHMQAAVQAQPADPVLQQELAYSLDQSGSRERAESVYRQVLARVPGATVTRSLLADNLYDRGRRDEAIALMRDGLGLTPNSPRLHRDMGSLLQRSGRAAEAAAAYAEYLRMAPNAPDAAQVAALVARLGTAEAGGAAGP